MKTMQWRNKTLMAGIMLVHAKQRRQRLVVLLHESHHQLQESKDCPSREQTTTVVQVGIWATLATLSQAVPTTRTT